jgi:hypothetical protein
MIVMKKIIVNVMCAVILLSGLGACKKNDNNQQGSAQVTMRLTDAPANYDAVYVDIRQVAVKVSGHSEIILAPARPGVYNLLDFRNGMDTMLLSAGLPAGKIEQIRLILGGDNSVIVAGISYPLNTPSAQESGLKLNFNTTLDANVSYTIWLDFDAGRSIVQTGNGNYKLKPVIRAYSAVTNGQISGYVMPLAAFATVYAIQGTDTSVAIPSSADGHFVIGGLVSGSYQVMVVPTFAPYITYTSNVNVSYATVTNLGTITLNP